MISRRTVLLAVLAGALVPSRSALAAKPLVTVHKDPSCGCCGAWAEHLEKAGFPVRIVENAKLNPLKAEKGVPKALWSCHTAEVEGYVIEGHVPAAEIERLLAERPAATGLAVAGMPVGSPGMEVAGYEPDRYEVALFGSGGQRVFARYEGAKRLG